MCLLSQSFGARSVLYHPDATALTTVEKHEIYRWSLAIFAVEGLQNGVKN
jgi:hypothetical protein